MRVWDAVTGNRVLALLVGHNSVVNAVAIGRMGKQDIIASGSDDCTVRIWDAITGEAVVGPLEGHNAAVNAVAIGRAGDRDTIVSGSDDRTVLVRRHHPRLQAP